MTKESSFTLIELLIVIGILAVLATIAVLALNPTELIKQARDSQRMADLATLNKALAVYQSSGQTNLGTINTIYVSIPSNQANCSDLGLPTSSPGWSYACVVSSTLRDSDGTGWIPLNFTAVSYGTPLEKLPVDPINTTSSGNYYTYVMGGSWELTTEFESQKYLPKAINDGDSYPGVYSLRTSSAPLTPGTRDYGLVGYWKFDEGIGTVANDSSGKGNNGTFINSPSWQTSANCKSGICLRFVAGNNAVQVPDNSSLDITNNLTILYWFKASSIVSSGDSFHPFAKWAGTTNANYVNYYCGSACGSNNTFVWYADTSGWGSISGSSPSLAIDTWYFVGFVFQNGGQNYWDGLPYGSFTSRNQLGTNSAILKIGNDSATNGDFIIDDVRIYNRALSAAEVMAIYNATK